MAEELTAAEIQRLGRELSAARESMQMWDRQADLFADRAADMLRVARELDHRSHPLDQILRPIRDLHVTATWDGNAATDSRRRLDAHEDRNIAALRRVNRLVDDLQANARLAGHHASEARNRHHHARRTAAQLESTLRRSA